MTAFATDSSAILARLGELRAADAGHHPRGAHRAGPDTNLHHVRTGLDDLARLVRIGDLEHHRRSVGGGDHHLPTHVHRVTGDLDRVTHVGHELGIVVFRDLLAHAIGVAVPVVSSYFGHKYISFRDSR
jgi:hypothetical protein